MAEMIVFNAKVREEEIAGEKVFVMNSGARNVGREFVLTRGEREKWLHQGRRAFEQFGNQR